MSTKLTRCRVKDLQLKLPLLLKALTERFYFVVLDMTSLIHLKLSSRTLMGIKSTDETPMIKTI